jgi:hypothetical protein
MNVLLATVRCSRRPSYNHIYNEDKTVDAGFDDAISEAKFNVKCQCVMQ